RALALEHHLTWLLRSKTTLIPSDVGMVLADESTKATKERIRKAHIKTVSVGRPLMNEQERKAKDGSDTKRFTVDDGALAWLSGMLDSQQFEKLGLQDEVFDGNLEVWLEVRYPKHQRSKPARSMRLLDELGLALRDFDPEQSRIDLGDGSVVQGKELRIMSKIETSMTKG